MLRSSRNPTNQDAQLPRVGYGLLVLRVVTGLVFFMHGTDTRNCSTMDVRRRRAGSTRWVRHRHARCLLHHAHGNGFFVPAGGYELVLLLGGGALALVLRGPGMFALDSLIDLPREAQSGLSLRQPHALVYARSGRRTIRSASALSASVRFRTGVVDRRDLRFA